MRRLVALILAMLAFVQPSAALTPAQELVLFGRGTTYYANLTTGSIPPWLSYASAGVRYYWDASGNLQTAPNNLIPNSAMQGAAVGVFPSGWGANGSSAGTVTGSVVATGNDSGYAYIDVLFAGTTAGTGYYSISFGPVIAASTGQSAITSVATKLISGSIPGSIKVNTNINNGSGYVAEADFTPFTGSSPLTITSGAFTIASAGVVSVQPFVTFQFTGVASPNFTLRIAAPQLSQVTPAQTTPNPFMPTSGSAYFGPVVNDHNPSTLASLGIRSEPQRTNLTPNGAGIGGSGATPPTGWFLDGAPTAGLTITYTRVAESGVSAIDVAISGTPTATGNINVHTAANVANTSGLPFAYSAFVRLSAGALTNITATHFVLSNSGGNTSSVAFTPQTSGIGANRLSSALTPTQSSTLVQYVVVGVAALSPVNITLRIGAPQLEQNPFPTSPALTYGSATTVPADNWSITGAPLVQAKTGNFCVAIQAMAEGAPANNSHLFTADDGSNNNMAKLYMPSSTTYAGAQVQSGGAGFIALLSNVGGDITTAPRTAVLSVGTSTTTLGYDGTVPSTVATTRPAGISVALLGQNNINSAVSWYGWFSRIMVRPSCTASLVQRLSTAGANLQVSNDNEWPMFAAGDNLPITVKIASGEW